MLEESTASVWIASPEPAAGSLVLPVPAARTTAPAQQRWTGLRLSLAERGLLLGLVDVALVNGALIAALAFVQGFPVSPPTLLAYAKWFATLTATWLVFAVAFDVYDPARAASTTYSATTTAVAGLLAALVYLAIPWLTPALGARLWAIAFVALTVAGLATWRALYARSCAQPAFQRRVVVVGGGATTRALARELHAAASDARANPYRGTGYFVTGIVEENLPAGEAGAELLPGLEAGRGFVHRMRLHGVDEIIVADGQALSPALYEAILDCRELGLRVTPLSTVYERLTARVPVDYAARDLRIVAGSGDGPAVRIYYVTKRVVDVLLALAGVILVILLAPFVALANACSSPGPLFYRQERVGRGGRPFALVKFRTMVCDAEHRSGAVWACQNDERITPIGRWLRRTRLDELPQFVNVLRGQMSVVGPRPERPQMIGELISSLPLYRARHAMRPGITGWAQIRYHYGESVEDARIKLEYDLFYVKHAGAWLDTLIFLQTIPVMLQFRGR
jgi:exopolysaccharide biosynthesis polyprenyl glycosylphosphotransferase